MDKTVKNYEYTEFAENIATELKNEFKLLPRENALAQYEKIKKYKGSSKYPHSMIDLFCNCGLSEVLAPERLKEKEVLTYLNSLPTQDEMTKDLMLNLYSVYKEYKTPGQYMERLVEIISDDEFENDSLRMKILKQMLKYLQKDCESIHPGVNAIIKDIKKNYPKIKKSKNISDIINHLDESIFLNTKNVFSLNDEDKKSVEGFLCNVIGKIDTNPVFEDHVNTYKRVRSLLEKIQEKSTITVNEISALKSVNDFIYIKDEEIEKFEKIDEEVIKPILQSNSLTEKQLFIISQVRKSAQEKSYMESRKLFINLALMFKNTVGTDQGETELKKEQAVLLEKVIRFINNNADNITLTDKKARIKIVNEEFSERYGNICSEQLIEEINVLITDIQDIVSDEDKEFINTVSAFLTERISVNKEKMQIIDSLYLICKKVQLEKQAQNTYDKFINMIESLNESKECDIKLAHNSKEFLKTIEDLATCTFRMNGATREALYLFAFAFGLKSFKNDDINYSKNKDIEKFFWDCYNDTVCRHLEFNNYIDNSSIPTGEGINYKNFAEVICLYFLSLEDTKYTRYEKYKQAMETIANCKRKAKASFESKDTYFYRNMYWDELLNIKDNNQLEDFICRNFYVPPSNNPVANSNYIRSTGIEKNEIEEILDTKLKTDESIRLIMLKRFIEYGFVGDGTITGVSAFVNKSIENKFDNITDKKEVCDKITDESIERFRALNIKEENKLLIRICNNLASGEFVKYSTAKENLFKFVMVFGMRLYKDNLVADYKENTDAEKMFCKFFADGINYDEKLDTICAYYLANDSYPLNKKLNSIQYRLKQAFKLYRTPGIEAPEDISIENKREYFWNEAVNMDEETFKNYVLTQFSQKNSNVSVNNIAVMSDEVTAYEIYNDILDEFDMVYEEQDIRSTLLDDVQVMRYWIDKTNHLGDEEFLSMLRGIEKMVGSIKDITKKNITRNDLIILNYHKIIEELHQDRDLEYVYDYAIDYINYDLERARFQQLNPKNFFDLFVICLLYMHCIDTPLF